MFLYTFNLLPAMMTNTGLMLYIFSLPSTKMTNTDLARLLRSDEIQAVLRAPE